MGIASSYFTKVMVLAIKEKSDVKGTPSRRGRADQGVHERLPGGGCAMLQLEERAGASLAMWEGAGS